MYVCIFSWTIGVVVFAVFEPSTFPFERIATASMLGILISILAAFRWPLFRWPGFLLLGILYAAWRAQGVLALQLPVSTVIDYSGSRAQ